jgi:ketosteroid isomerase-like protein
MTATSDILDALDGLLEAFNDHDLDRIMEFFADDCSLDMPRGQEPWGTRYIGKLAVRKGLRTRFEMLPDVHYGDVRHFATGNRGFSEWLLTGTLRSGETIAVRGCDHYEFRDGKVVRKDAYWKIVE